MAQPPDAVAPPPRHPRFPLFDGMRGIAVLLVVLTHVAGATTGIAGSLPGRLLAHMNLGVTVFFLISGFLLFRPFVAIRAGGAAPPAVGSYVKRRALRILPAYWLALAVLALVPGAPTLGGVSLWSMATLTQTLPIHPGPPCSLLLWHCSLAQTWSLGAEVTFYAALPVYVAVSEYLTRRLRLAAWAAAQAICLLTLATASVLLAYVLVRPAPLWIGWTVTGTVLWFALGMGLAVVSVLAERPGAGASVTAFTRTVGRLSGVLWATAIVLYVAVTAWLPATAFVSTQAQLIVVHLVFGLVAVLLLAPVALAGDRRGVAQRLAGHPALSRLGLISYGVFLWHFAVVIALGPAHGWLGAAALTAGTLAVSIAIATASYLLLERPLMRLKYRPLDRRPWSRTPDRVRVSAP